MKKSILLTIAIFTTYLVNAQTYTVKLDTVGTPPFVTIVNNVPLTVTITPSFAIGSSTLINVRQSSSTYAPWIVLLQRSGITYTISNTNMASSTYPFNEILTTTAWGIECGDKITVIKDRTSFLGDIYTVVFVISGNIPTANFSVSSPNYVNAPVNFTDLSSNSPTSWGWQIQSATSTYTSNAQNPTMTFTTSGTYTVYFICDNSCGQSNLVSQTFTVSMATSINEHLSNSFKIYPNPAKDFINIEFEKITNIEITDIVGQVLYNENVTKTTVDISNYQTGLYFIKTKNLSYKFIKQ